MTYPTSVTVFSTVWATSEEERILAGSSSSRNVLASSTIIFYLLLNLVFFCMPFETQPVVDVPFKAFYEATRQDF